MKINVLWIDDQPNDSFMDRADSKGINITNKKNVDDGIEELMHFSHCYDAIILDANCLYHRTQQDKDVDISALAYAFRRINEEKIVKPWFVYSAGGFSGESSIDVLVKGQERPYDDVIWYKKPSEMDELFSKIKSVVLGSSIYQIKIQYPEIFEWYPRQTELINIISFLDQSKKQNPAVLHLIRLELESLMELCNKCGYLQTKFEKTNLSECSRDMGRGELTPFIPIYIQRCFHSTVELCNEGSHRLKIEEDVKAGKAPYLVHSIILEFLNILYWLKDRPCSEESIEFLKQQIKEVTSNKTPKFENNGDVFTVEKDENGFFHCDKYLINNKIGPKCLGKQVSIFDINENHDSRSSAYYPYYAKIKEQNLKVNTRENINNDSLYNDNE